LQRRVFAPAEQGIEVQFRRRNKGKLTARPGAPRLLPAAAAVAGLLLSGCQMLDYKRADGGLGADLAGQTAGARPWAVLASGNDSAAKLGAEQNPRILAAYGGEYRDAKLERMVAKIVGRLTAVSDNPSQTYQVVILDSANINAFALPGGYVYVTRGLLALANDSAEVAAVIAHEMEHINANHGVLRRDKEQEIALSERVANEVLTGGNRDETLIRSRLSLARFSREQELAADRGGIRMAAAAGYDPFASPRFLQTMEDYSRFRDLSGAQDAGLDFLSNHPSTPQRITLALAEARRISAPGVGEADRATFLRGIDGMIFGDSIADNGFYIRGQSFIDSHIGLIFAAPPGYQLSYKNNVVTAAGSNDTALRFDTEALDSSAGPGDPAAYIAAGWISGLDQSSIRRLRVGGWPAAQAQAQNGKWQFNVLALMDGKRVYRFLSAAPKGGADPAALNMAAAKTFRLLSPAEKAAVKPPRLRIAIVKSGDTVASLAAMQPLGNDRGADLFRILNGLSANQAPQPGDKVKLILP